MKFIKMKIREHFLDLIRNGSKKHEYRLADPRYKNVNVGDVLILVSNQDEKNLTKVVVDKIVHCSDWEEALNSRWENDFKGLFSSMDDVLKECHRFYKKDLIDKYGIEVFTIRPYTRSHTKARILLDTNTIIEREGTNNVSTEVACCYQAMDKLNCTKFIHDLSIKEIEKYNIAETKTAMLVKIKAYETLISSPEKTPDFDRVCQIFSQDENSKNDNELLKQVFNGTVDFLITSDQAIIKKSKLLLINDYVLSPYDFLERFGKENPKLIEYDALSIKLVKVGTLDINDQFFDTLREDYGGAVFNDWLKRKSNEEAYVFKNKDGLQGFLYLKNEGQEENYSRFDPVFEPKFRLKVGTFKIAASGLRLGERFLKIIFDNAKKRNVDEIYVTMFEDKRPDVKRLKEMMEEWGFVKKAINRENGEIVLVKNMRDYAYDKSPKFNYPILKNKLTYSFLPILSEYHTRLFPDLHLRNEDLTIYDEEACRYAIEKIYVCGYSNIEASPGDIMCVYRMSNAYKTYRSVVSGIVVLNDVIRPKSEDEFVKECKNKSVFSEEQLRGFYQTGKYKTIVKVLYLDGFENKINLYDLYENGILNREGQGPRINSFISEDSYKRLLKLGKE